MKKNWIMLPTTIANCTAPALMDNVTWSGISSELTTVMFNATVSSMDCTQSPATTEM